MDDKFVPFHEFFDVFKPINLEPNKRLQVLIILSAVHDLMISDPNKWRLPSAALDYGCNIEDDVEIGIFPNHTEKGLKGKARWKNDFNHLYNILFGNPTDDSYIYRLLDSGNVIDKNPEPEYNFKYISYSLGLTETLKIINRLLLLHQLDSNHSIYLKYNSSSTYENITDYETLHNIIVWLHSDHFANQVLIQNKLKQMDEHIMDCLGISKIQARIILITFISLGNDRPDGWNYIHAFLTHDKGLASKQPFFSELAKKVFCDNKICILFNDYIYAMLHETKITDLILLHTKISSINAIFNELNGSPTDKLIQLYYVITFSNYSDYKSKVESHGIASISTRNHNYISACIDNYAVESKNDFYDNKVSILIDTIKKHGIDQDGAITLYTHFNQYTRNKPNSAVKTAILKLDSDFKFLENKLQNKKVSPLSFVRTLQDNNCDSCAESNFIYEAFTKRIYHKGQRSVIIVNPSYELIDKWFSDIRVHDCFITFVIPELKIANLLAHMNDKKHAFVHISELENLHRTYDSGLFFVRSMECKDTASVLESIFSYLRHKSVIDILMPDQYLNDYETNSAIDRIGFFYKRIILMQTGLAESTPKKKSYVRLASLEICKTVNTAFLRSVDIKDSKRKVLRFNKYEDISHNDIKEKFNNIRQEYKFLRQSKIETKRNAPNHYSFTQELSVYYTFTLQKNGRHRALVYATEIPSAKQKKYNKLARGKMISGSEIYLHGDSQEEIKKNIPQAILSPKIRESVSSYVISALTSEVVSDISLGSFWYCFEKRIFSESEGYSSKRAALMFSNNNHAISKCLLKASTVNDIKTAMTSFSQAENISDDSINGYWNVLDYMTRVAVKLNIMSPKSEVAIFFSERRKKPISSSQEVRDALTKKSLTKNEEVSLINYVINKINQGSREYLGVLIRIFTGLDPDEICALKWADFDKITNMNVYYLKVFKRVDKYENMIGPRTSDRIRLVPLISYITIRMKRLKTHIVKSSTDDIDQYPIVSYGNDFSRVVSLKHFRKISEDALINGANISEVFISIPEKNNRNRSIISNYQGDLYRSNFRYSSTEVCGLSQGELSYIIGNLPLNTLSRHYCDYSSDFMLLSMFYKLDRWRALYTPYSNVPNHCEFTVSDNALTIEAKPISSKRTSIDLELAIPSTGIKSNSEIRVVLSSSHGLEGKVYLSEIIGFNELQTQKTPKEEIPLD
jgi:hypothetical protein